MNFRVSWMSVVVGVAGLFGAGTAFAQIASTTGPLSPQSQCEAFARRVFRGENDRHVLIDGAMVWLPVCASSSAGIYGECTSCRTYFQNPDNFARFLNSVETLPCDRMPAEFGMPPRVSRLQLDDAQRRFDERITNWVGNQTGGEFRAKLLSRYADGSCSPQPRDLGSGCDKHGVTVEEVQNRLQEASHTRTSTDAAFHMPVGVLREAAPFNPVFCRQVGECRFGLAQQPGQGGARSSQSVESPILVATKVAACRCEAANQPPIPEPSARAMIAQVNQRPLVRPEQLIPRPEFGGPVGDARNCAAYEGRQLSSGPTLSPLPGAAVPSARTVR